MSLYRETPEPDRSMQVRSGGAGLAITWRCMGCNKPRLSQGSRGVGVKRRCAICLEAKEKKQ